MLSDADVHDEARWSRLKKSADDEAASGEKSLVELSVGAPGRHHSEAAPFLAGPLSTFQLNFSCL